MSPTVAAAAAGSTAPPASPVPAPSFRRAAFFAGVAVGLGEAAAFVLERPVHSRLDRAQVALTLLFLVPAAWTTATVVLGAVYRLSTFRRPPRSPARDAVLFVLVVAVAAPLVETLFAGPRIARQPLAQWGIRAAFVLVAAAVVAGRRVFRRLPDGRARSSAGWLAAAAAAAAWLVDRRLYPGQYPTAHALLSLATLVLATLFFATRLFQLFADNSAL